MSDFLGYEGDPLPIAKARPWVSDAHGAVPDLACLDEDDNVVALIESKFWAPLTRNQPVAYWEGLPKEGPAVLFFLAPEIRIEEDSLWNELAGRLRNAKHELGPAVDDKEKGVVTALSKDSKRHLMLTSWQTLLGCLTRRVQDDKDQQARFEIAELQGLAASVIAGDNPVRDENLKRLIAEAVERVEQSGWANTDGLSVGIGYDYYVRFLRLAGANAWVGIDYEALKQTPDQPLWLSFYGGANADVDKNTVRDILGDDAQAGVGGRKDQVYVPIILPAGADYQATLNSIVSFLECIAGLIDPSGPTYGQSS